MNAATRVLETQRMQSLRSVSVGMNLTHVSRQGIWTTVLVALVMLSAFTIIYSKDLERRLFIQYQEQQQLKENALVEWNKLLLEQSAWSAQLRIQKIATEDLGMVAPKSGDVVLIAADN